MLVIITFGLWERNYPALAFLLTESVRDCKVNTLHTAQEFSRVSRNVC